MLGGLPWHFSDPCEQRRGCGALPCAFLTLFTFPLHPHQINSVNYSLGPKEDRMLMTGMHTVCDIFCNRQVEATPYCAREEERSS